MFDDLTFQLHCLFGGKNKFATHGLSFKSQWVPCICGCIINIWVILWLICVILQYMYSTCSVVIAKLLKLIELLHILCYIIICKCRVLFPYIWSTYTYVWNIRLIDLINFVILQEDIHTYKFYTWAEMNTSKLLHWMRHLTIQGVPWLILKW